jgi:hypothetical protein
MEKINKYIALNISIFVLFLLGFTVHGALTDTNTLALTISTGSLDVTASSTVTFTGASFSFSSQNSSNNALNCVEVADTRGTSAGWSVNITGADWSDGSDTMDYDGNGTATGQLSLNVPVIGSVTYNASGDDTTGFTMGADDAFDSGTATINLVTVTSTNGSGQYYINDLQTSQFIPGNQAEGAYTLALLFTAS